MSCSDVKLACCRLCKKPLASNLGECIHCGVCKPVEEEKCCWLHRFLFGLLALGALMAALCYERPPSGGWECEVEHVRHARHC